MSFSGDVKKELSGVIPQARHCQLAEAAALLMLAGRGPAAGEDGVILRTENRAAARKLFTLLQQAFNMDVVISENPKTRGETVTVSVPDPEKRNAVRKSVSHASLLNQECCRRAFLRGAFIAAGSLSAPEKYYHFEIVCPDGGTAETVRSVMNACGYEARTVLRKKDHVVYLKEGDVIAELLGAMGASISFLNIENIRILKEMRGSINRQCNCETANLNRTIVTSVRQVEDIRYIRDHGGFGALTPSLRQMAEARLDNPEATLQELADSLEPRIGKSGANHRLRKLSAIADEMRSKEQDL